MSYTARIMVDRLFPERRSWLMSRVHAKNTRPEMKVRSTLHALGYRYRLHRADLPGKPDLVFPSRRKIIFVHGCFWHGHGCRGGREKSKTNVEFWDKKIIANRQRDKRNIAKLRRLGWGVAVIWECELKNSIWISRITRYLGPVGS